MSTLAWDLIARDRASGTFNKVGNAAEGAGSKFKKLGSLAKVGAVALAGGAVIAGKALWDAGQRASDLNETISKTNQIFGSKGGAALSKWAEGTAVALGQSKQTALDAAATFGVFGKSAGKTGKDLVEFSKQNTQLAADLASFHNTSPEEAITALGAAFRGETEPIRRFGVLLDDASMRAEAVKMGLIETTKEALTPQQKVLAAHALVMKQTGDAQGDFARTSDGLANQQRILKAQFEDLQASIGQKVVPVMASLFSWANSKLIPAVSDLASKAGDKLGPAFEKVAGWAKSDLIPAVMELASSAADTLIPVIMSLVGWVMDDLVPALMGLWSSVLPGVQDAMSMVAHAFERAQPFFSLVGKLVTNILLPAIGKLARVVLPLLGGALVSVGEFLRAVGKAGEWMWNNALQPVFQFLAKAIGKTLEFFGRMLQVIGMAPKMGWVGELGDKMVNAGEDAQGLADDIKKIPDRKNTKLTVDDAEAKRKVQDFAFLVGNIPASKTVNLFAKWSGNVQGNPLIPGQSFAGNNAAGTQNFRGGLTWVGERGPELVRLPAGSRVFSANDSAAMTQIDYRALAKAIVGALREGSPLVRLPDAARGAYLQTGGL